MGHTHRGRNFREKQTLGIDSQSFRLRGRCPPTRLTWLHNCYAESGICWFLQSAPALGKPGRTKCAKQHQQPLGRSGGKSFPKKSSPRSPEGHPPLSLANNPG
eukprot:3714933-Pyramimonas_sp.AAC.1